MEIEECFKKQCFNAAEIKKKEENDMCSSVSGPSKPKSVARCEKCNNPILCYKERIGNIAEKIAYGQDGRPHQCPNQPFYRIKPIIADSCGPTSSTTRIDTSEAMLAEILRIVQRIEKNTSKSLLGRDSDDNAKGARR
jgi:hypothetical protein